MSEETPSPSVSGLSAETIATLLSKFEEQNLLIQELKDRVVLLEGRASEPPIASPVPVPLQSDVLAAFAKAHAESLAALSNASSPSPSVPLGRNTSALSPTFSPPFGYPYGPYPGFYYPGMHYPPPNWGAMPNHSSAAEHPSSDAPPTNTNNEQMATADEKSLEAASAWGGPVNNGTSTPCTEAVAGSSSSLNSAKKGKSKAKPCKFGDQCNRPECWFEHPGRTKSGLQHNDSPNSMYPPKSSNNTSNPGDSSNQFGRSTKSRTACRYAENCTRQECMFTHPTGWTPSLAPEPTTDQNTSASVDHSVADQDWGTPATGDSGWGTEHQETTNTESNQWESWEVKPSNDWGVSSTNEWGPPASNENEWGPPANDDWATASNTKNNQNSSSANTSRKAPAAKKPDSKLRKGKERVTSPLQSTPSQPAVSTHPATVNISLDSVAEPLANTKEPSLVDESPIVDAVVDAVVDSLPTPPLEPEHTSTSSSSLSESDNLPTPFAWGDEPLDNVRNEEQAPEEQALEEPVALGMIAPSSMYDSWGPVENSGWGFEDPPAPKGVEAQTKSVKGKGKQKETGQGKAVDDSHNENNDAPLADSSAVDVNEVEGLQTASPDLAPVPQGVPEDEIPDWLLGETEDPYAALGITRPITPKPTPRPTPTPTVSASSQPPSNRPRMSEMNGANFPPPQATTNYQAPKTSVASGPTIRPRRTAFTIIPSGEPSTAQNARSSSSKESGKGSGKQPKKQYRPNNKQNAKGSK